jgi:hypothetical protein
LFGFAIIPALALRVFVCEILDFGGTLLVVSSVFIVRADKISFESYIERGEP